jgi:hypothetical protein
MNNGGLNGLVVLQGITCFATGSLVVWRLTQWTWVRYRGRRNHPSTPF